MGKGLKYIIISGFDINDNNRGTAALGYGSISFLKKNHGLEPNTRIIVPSPVKKWWKYKDYTDTVLCDNEKFIIEHFYYSFIEDILLKKFGILLPFTKFGKVMKNLEYVAAINGGDGFSDIYGTNTFLSRLGHTLLAMSSGKSVILLPQTIGPFEKKENIELASKILQYANCVYVRDDKYVKELEAMKVKYKLTNDLSAYMEPEPFDFDIRPNSIGLNISGLAYSNEFRSLKGQFFKYPFLCKCIVEYFQSIGKTVYLISHSYNYDKIEESNDDMQSSRQFYESLDNKENVILVDKNLNSPQTKYLISKMSFFIGTRMHANFAAIFTKVPVFGLAYSFKFEGAFNKNGLYDQTSMINNIEETDVDTILNKIKSVYNKYNSNE